MLDPGRKYHSGTINFSSYYTIIDSTGQYPLPDFIKRSIADREKSPLEDSTIDPQESSIYSELAALEGTKKSTSIINIKLNSPRPKHVPSQPGKIIQFPVNETIKESPIFQTFQNRKAHLNFVCQRLRKVIDLNQKNDDNFDELRAGYEAQDANFCKVDGVDMTDTECREKIVADVESTMLILAVFGFLLASGMVAVMYITLRTIKSMKGTTLVEKIVDVVDDVVPVSDRLQRCQNLAQLPYQ